MSNPRPGRLAVLVSSACALLVGALLAACGGSTGQPVGTGTGAASTAPGGKTRDIEFSDCMRSHGVTNFPDPGPNGLQIPVSVNPRSPGFRSAQAACKRYLPNGGNPPATPAVDRAAAVTLAKCMRTHGVSDFPDPAFTAPTSAPRVLVMRGMVFAIPSSVDPKAPAFQQAARACGFGQR
ncbi:MAG: hypothetical protein JO130_13625 [Solirubrobacterales bacterium]|nr:hypothetical protein [Solirubrobacterales bacterium]